jgi:hypothetical protein
MMRKLKLKLHNLTKRFWGQFRIRTPVFFFLCRRVHFFFSPQAELVFYSIYLTFLFIIRFYPSSILDDGVNKIFVIRAQMCDALEVATFALFAPILGKFSWHAHYKKQHIWKTQKKMEWKYIAQYWNIDKIVNACLHYVTNQQMHINTI